MAELSTVLNSELVLELEAEDVVDAVDLEAELASEVLAIVVEVEVCPTVVPELAFVPDCESESCVISGSKTGGV